MTTHKDTGTIERTEVLKKTYEEELIEWRFPDFATIVKTKDMITCYDSPTFIVSGTSWFLRLYPTQGSNLEFMRMYLMAEAKREYAVEYNFSLKKSDGSMMQIQSGIMEGNKPTSQHRNFISRSDILPISQDVVALICRLKYEVTHSTQPISSDKTKTLKLISK